ncbi:MAG: hypothetical protein GY754_44125 [bacterium]|nr:hypothetical protein [bacterium]
MEKIGVIINPYAKFIRRQNKPVDQIYTDVNETWVDLQVTNSIEEVDEAVKRFKKDKISYIGICGGDGTLHSVLTRVIKIYPAKDIPPILILKGGTMDNVARTITLKGKGPAILSRFVDSLARKKEIRLYERDIMKVGDRYCFLFGLGFVTNLVNVAYSGKEKGFVSNLRIFSQMVSHAVKEPKTGSIYEGVQAKVYVDNKLLDFEYITGLYAGTVEHVGMGFSPLMRVNTKDEAFQAMITGLGPRDILKNILNVKNGTLVECANHFDGLIENLRIESEKEFQFTMDGDLFTSEGSLEVEVGPRLKLIEV